MVRIMIPITRALIAEHRMFGVVFEQIEKLLPGLDRLEEVRRAARMVEGLLLSHAKAPSPVSPARRDWFAAPPAASWPARARPAAGSQPAGSSPCGSRLPSPDGPNRADRFGQSSRQ